MVQLNNRLIADVTYKPLTGPGINPTDGVDATLKFEKLVSNALGILTILAVLFFTIQIIFAGYGFISSGGDEKMMETSRKKLTNGVLGLFIVIVSVGIASLIAKLLGLDGLLDINQMFTKMNL